MNRKQGKAFFQLTKPGIVGLVLMCGLAGYGLAFQVEKSFSLLNFLSFAFGLCMLSAGSLALNQAQDHLIDSKMKRTQLRPIPSGQITVQSGYFFSISILIVGLGLLYFVEPLCALLGLITALLYNIPYTLYWKRKDAFGAVPGAFPGAMPAVIGYAANSKNIFSTECVYLFLIMFLWQMPHFWSLAIKYADDYRDGGVPVLPVQKGTSTTLFHMALYVFLYAGLALLSPLFVHAYVFYIFLVIPLTLKVGWEFFRYYQSGAKKRWLPFFLWVNFSMLAFLVVPVIDKWLFLFARAK